MRVKFTPAVVTGLLSAVAILGFVGYRVATHPTTPTLPATLPAAQVPSPKHLVATLPDFSLQNLAGKQQSITSLAGKPMLINFWATWCGPCRREIPMLKTVQDKNPSVRVVGIAVDNRDAVLKYAKQMQFNYPILMGQAGAMAAASSFGVDFYALPFTVFVAANGDVLGVHTGALHEPQVENVLNVFKLLTSKKIDVHVARERIAARI